MKLSTGTSISTYNSAWDFADVWRRINLLSSTLEITNKAVVTCTNCAISSWGFVICDSRYGCRNIYFYSGAWKFANVWWRINLLSSATEITLPIKLWIIVQESHTRSKLSERYLWYAKTWQIDEARMQLSKLRISSTTCGKAYHARISINACHRNQR